MEELKKRLAALPPERQELFWRVFNQKKTVSSLSLQKRETTIYPLSFGQQRVWAYDQSHPGNVAYSMPVVVSLTGCLNKNALESGINRIVERHEILRTIFRKAGEQTAQVVIATLKVPLVVVDLRMCSLNVRTAMVQKLSLEESQRPFNLSCGPLIRTTLLQIEKERYVLLLTLHHIVFDAWSINIFFQELAAYYEEMTMGRPAILPELPIQYANFAAWQQQWLRGSVLEELLAYWKQVLAQAPEILRIPMDRPRSSMTTSKGGHYYFILPKSLVEQLEKFNQQEEMTLFMTLLAAFKLLLFRYTHQSDICILTPIATRSRVEVENLIGYFINRLLLRTRVSGEMTFRALVRRVREVTLSAYTHQDLPFELLIEELRAQKDSRYDTWIKEMYSIPKFSLPNTQVTALKIADLTIDFQNRGNRGAKFDLFLDFIATQDGLQGCFEYKVDLFDTSSIERMAKQFRLVLEYVLVNPEQCIKDIPLLLEPH